MVKFCTQANFKKKKGLIFHVNSICEVHVQLAFSSVDQQIFKGQQNTLKTQRSSLVSSLRFRKDIILTGKLYELFNHDFHVYCIYDCFLKLI